MTNNKKKNNKPKQHEPLLPPNQQQQQHTTHHIPPQATGVDAEQHSPSLRPANVGGLSQDQVERRRIEFGFNEVDQKQTHWYVKLALKFWGPMPWLIEVAAIVSAALLDWKDFAFLLALLIINGLVAFAEEHKAGNAIDALKASLAPTARVLRDGKWEVLPARELVPDDVVLLRLGDVVPADAVLGAGEPMDIDQSALTGESLPVTKFEGETVFQGSAIKRGELQAIVTHTGGNSFFGKAAALVDSVNRPGNFQMVLFSVAKMLIALASLLVTIIFFVLVFDDARAGSCATTGCRVASAVKLCLVLLVASIPIAMQVVCTTTMAVGSRALAAKAAIVARLSAIEELAGMTILCSDKTGTLTKNQLTLGEPTLLVDKLSPAELTYMAGLACKHEGEQEPIDRAICEHPDVADAATPISAYEVLRFVPFDPVRKRTEATLRAPDGSVFSVSKGSPQVIADLVTDEAVRERVRATVDAYAARGFRTLGVARSKKGGSSGAGLDGGGAIAWEYLGVLSLYDPPRDDTAVTCANAMALGNEVKMITGDHIAIAKETSRQLGLGTSIVRPDVFAHSEQLGDGFITRYGDYIEGADGFAEVMPEHKFAIVDVLQRRGHIVGMTGDGVNDAPALKQADIGIAVQGATDAARAAADIVLMSPGLSVIIDAIVLSRGIFQRMKNYCTYRIACTTQILLFFFIAIIWQGFQIPVFVICLISILNDGTIMSIAYDRVQPSRSPEAWDLPQTVGISATIGIVGVCATFFLLYLAQCDPHGGTCSHFFTSLSGGSLFPHQLAEAQVQALIYLQLSIGGQATIFVARTRGFFFRQRPGTALMIAFAFAQTISTLVVIYCAGNLAPMIGLGMNCDVTAAGGVAAVNACTASVNGTTPDGHPCVSLCEDDPTNGWKFAAFTWLYCLVWLFGQDLVKLAAVSAFDMADPEKAARRKLKIENKILMGRHSQMLGPSRGDTLRSTLRSTANGLGESHLGAGGLERATDPCNVLEPQVERTDAGALPQVVARLQARVDELEGELRRRPTVAPRSHHAILTGDSGDGEAAEEEE